MTKHEFEKHYNQAIEEAKTYLDDELGRLLKKPNMKACDFTEYKIWVFSNYLMGTGNRISSALNIKIMDLDFDNALIQVNKAKNRKAQMIPMSATLSTVLQEYLVYRKGEATDYLFCNSSGGRGDTRTYQEMLASSPVSCPCIDGLAGIRWLYELLSINRKCYRNGRGCHAFAYPIIPIIGNIGFDLLAHL